MLPVLFGAFYTVIDTQTRRCPCFRTGLPRFWLAPSTTPQPKYSTWLRERVQRRLRVQQAIHGRDKLVRLGSTNAFDFCRLSDP